MRVAWSQHAMHEAWQHSPPCTTSDSVALCAAAMAKAKATKHTAAELAAKAKAALQNKGGGNAGKAGACVQS
jgi:hypothetical protein